MWNDPIVEETRKLRDEYAAQHGYNIHRIAEDLRQWEKQGFPMAAIPNTVLDPTVLPPLELRQNGGLVLALGRTTSTPFTGPAQPNAKPANRHVSRSLPTQ